MSDNHEPIDLDDLQRVAVLVRERTGDNWLADMVEIARAEIARLREERRWIAGTRARSPLGAFGKENVVDFLRNTQDQRLATADETTPRGGIASPLHPLVRNTMSYDLGLRDAVTGETLELESPHHMRGGTYAIGGSATAEINITYNYSEHFYRVLGEGGIRSLYGKSGAETIPMLEAAIAQLGDDVDADYWAATEGNAKRALLQCLALARMRPDGVWGGD